jgi:cytoskeletal protein CcmA (bactofilin family)
MRKLCLCFVLAGTVLATGAANAAELVRAAEYTLGPDETLASDLLVAAGTVIIDGVVEGDVLVVGGHVEINGTIRGDVKVAARELYVRGEIGQDVHLAAAQATLSGQFDDDVFVAAGTVDVLAEFRCGDDLHVTAGEAALEGEVTGDLFAGCGVVHLRCAVGADTYLTARTVRVSTAASIEGTLYYMTGEPVDIPDGVAGHVLFRQPPVDEEPPSAVVVLWLVRTFLVLAGFVLLTVVVRRVAPRIVAGPAEQLRNAPGRTLLRGVFVSVLFLWVPVASVFAVLLAGLFWGVVPALVLASLVVGAAGSLWVWSPLVTGYWLGRVLRPRTEATPLTSVLLGVLVVALLGRVPILGLFVYLASFLLALGSIARAPGASSR